MSEKKLLKATASGAFLEVNNGCSIFDSVKDTVADLHRVGLIDDVTLKNIESLCVPEVKQYDAADIAAIKKRLRLSQAAFARFLNISPSTIRKWEIGTKQPSGACRKLLSLADRKGLEGLM